MRILFACGGTGGHINPAIAVASYLRQRQPQAVILFAGNPKGMEAKLVPQAGFDFTPITIMGIQRQLNWFNIKYNVKSVCYLATASARSRKLLRDFRPDVVLGTGGYVSGPILREAAKMGIHTLAHEQNAYPGVTNKLLARHVDKMLLAVEEAREQLHCEGRYAVVGNPIREEILYADREKARKKLGVSPERMCIVSFGGSQGAKRLNEAMAGLISRHWREGKIHHIHATGKLGVQLLPQLLGEDWEEIRKREYIDIREYITDMADCLAAADLVIGRSGAITLSEIQAAGRASILIPSPNVAENHQYHNAMVLANRDAAIVIEEKDLTPGRLWEEVERLLGDRERLKQLGRNAQNMAIVDANERIYREILADLGK